jgi:hypothetical protein
MDGENSNTAKHTPGPWTQEPYIAALQETWRVVNQDGLEVAEEIGEESDARLIAAAPDLLTYADDSLAYIHDIKQIIDEDEPDYGSARDLLGDLLKAAMVVIGKATI